MNNLPFYKSTTPQEINDHLQTKYKWSTFSANEPAIISIMNQKGSLAASVTVKKGRYRISNTGGHLLLSGNGNILDALDDVLLNYFQCKAL